MDEPSEPTAEQPAEDAKPLSFWGRIWAWFMKETPVDEEEERIFWWATR